jgi:hypothetical protein
LLLLVLLFLMWRFVPALEPYFRMHPDTPRSS